jgi:uncharacterized membrane protein
MTPISELRGAIPVALSVYHLSPLQTYLLAVLGNMIPVFILVWFWQNLSQFLAEHSHFFKKLFSWIFTRTEKRTSKKFEIYGSLALILFVAIPLPFTGAWTGTICAFLFKVSYWKAIGLILIGVLISGLVVTAASLGIISLF